jgi:preprotein translocase subunit SecF
MKIWNFDFYKNKRRYLFVSLFLAAVLAVGMISMGAKLDIQFKGGALITYSHDGQIPRAQFQKDVEEILGESVTVQESSDIVTGSKSFVVSLAASHGISAQKQLELSQGLDAIYSQNELKTTSINVVNPTIGAEFLAKSLIAILVASILMVLYISIRFRRISGWMAGITAVLALTHDVLVVFMVFVLLRIPLNINFIAVSLTILGYSINDTIVVYDRIRENKRLYSKSLSTPQLVNKSLNQSFTRSLMTSVTTIMAMVVVSAVAGIYKIDSILSFSVPMTAGMVSGFYSSICIAPNLWAVWQERRSKTA